MINHWPSRGPWLCAAVALFCMSATLIEAAKPPPPPPPTLANVPYGPDPLQVLDFWKAPSSPATPVVFYIHGGAWLGGDKDDLQVDIGEVNRFLAAGISVVSINYRLIKQTIRTDDSVPLATITPGQVAHEDPPVLVPLSDAAAEWNLDKTRIGLSGGSAGGCTSLWLCFHPDMADPTSGDPVARESTRPWCAALAVPQTTLDPQQMKEWTPNSIYGGHAFGFRWNPRDPHEEFDQFLAHRAVVLPWIEKYSPYALMTSDSPPLYLSYPNDTPAYGQDKNDPTHTANFGALLAEKARKLGVECEFNYHGASVVHPSIGDYLIWKLKAPTQFSQTK